jgi:uncharacterized protein DUF3515
VHRTRWLPSLLAGCGLLAAACGVGAVRVPVPAPDPAIARLCAGLRLPDRLHGESRRSTEPASPLLAAWGSPPIALRCGVPRPAALLPASELVTINGVNWFPEPPDRPVTFTAVGRRAYVEVTVPAKYAPAGDVLLELTAMVKAVPEKPDGEL